MKHLGLCLILSLVSLLGIQAQNIEDLQVIIDKQNALCPLSFNNGITRQSVILDNKNITYNVHADPSQVELSRLESRKGLFHDSKVMELTTESSSDAIAPYCVKFDISVVYHFTDGSSSFDMIITPKELR